MTDTKPVEPAYVQKLFERSKLLKAKPIEVNSYGESSQVGYEYYLKRGKQLIHAVAYFDGFNNDSYLADPVAVAKNASTINPEFSEVKFHIYEDNQANRIKFMNDLTWSPEKSFWKNAKLIPDALISYDNNSSQPKRFAVNDGKNLVDIGLPKMNFWQKAMQRILGKLAKKKTTSDVDVNEFAGDVRAHISAPSLANSLLRTDLLTKEGQLNFNPNAFHQSMARLDGAKAGWLNKDRIPTGIASAIAAKQEMAF